LCRDDVTNNVGQGSRLAGGTKNICEDLRANETGDDCDNGVGHERAPKKWLRSPAVKVKVQREACIGIPVVVAAP